MKCNVCGSPMAVNSKGEVHCPTCSKLKRKISVVKTTYGDFTYYKTKDTVNVVVDEYLLPEELNKLVNQGVEVKIK